MPCNVFLFTMKDLTYPYPVHRITIQNNIELAYMDEGKGKSTLIFIHGLANYAPVWKHQMEGLKKDYRCVALDLPGNGISSRDDYPYSMFFYAECIKQFVDGLKIENPVLVGHSMGGQISIMLSLRYPAVFQKMILIASAGIEYFSATDKMIMQNLMNLGDFFYADEFHLEGAIRDSFEKPGDESNTIIKELKMIMRKYSSKQWRDMSTASVHAMLNEQVNSFLPQVTSETLILFGEKDRFIPNRLLHSMDSPEKIAQQGAALIPNSEMHLIKHAGHFVHIEKHDEVNQHIKSWLGYP